MKYKILSKTSSNELEQEVNKYLAKGYKLQGSPNVVKTSYYDEWFQAVLKPDKLKKKVI